MLGKLGQGPSMPQQQQPRVSDTTDTSGEDSDVEQPRRRVRSRRTFEMKNGYAVGELAQFFVTGPTDAANKLSEFFARCAGRMFLYVRTGSTKSSDIFRDTAIFLAISDFASRHLVGGCWILTGTRSLKTSSKGSGKELCLRH